MYKRIDAINLALESVGQLPITTEHLNHPDAISASNTLDRLLIAEQTHGYWFNTELGYQLSRNDDEVSSMYGTVALPQNVLRVELCDGSSRAVLRGQRLYDIVNNTYQWDEAPKVNMVLCLDFEELPTIMQQYIMYSSAMEFQAHYEGDSSKYKDLAARAQMYRTDIRREQTRWLNTNRNASPSTSRMLGRMRPYSGGINPVFPGGRARY